MSDPRVPAILRGRPWRVRPEHFALVGLPPSAYPAAAGLLAELRAPFTQLIAEPDIITLLLPAEAWQAQEAALPPAQFEQPFRIISFDVDLPPDLVGFLAAASAALAAAGVPILAVCGYTKDHIAVREQHLAATLAALEALAGTE